MDAMIAAAVANHEIEEARFLRGEIKELKPKCTKKKAVVAVVEETMAAMTNLGGTTLPPK